MEEINNQAAPEQGDNDNAATTDNTPNAAESAEATNPTGNVEPAAPAFDPRTSYDSLSKELQTVSKSYKELLREFTRRNQDSSEIRRQMDNLHKIFTEATKQEISPEEFMKTLQTQGVKAFDPLRENWTKDIKSDYEKAISERDARLDRVQSDMAAMRRELDPVNYPDFASLKPVMKEIAESDNCPIDWNQGPDEIYDALYKLAKSSKADESVREAKKLGQKEEQARSAKEAKAAVAGGGTKSYSTAPNFDTMPLAEMRKHMIEKFGLADV